MSARTPQPAAPEGQRHTVAVIDSGVGGLSVLRALRQALPQARFVYAADRAFAPYGEKPPALITERVLRIAEHLRREQTADVLVIACNTATAMAVERLRAEHPDWPIVGVEPALKPAASESRNGHIGVMATRGTVTSQRFAQLRDRVLKDAGRPLHIVVQACDGLADAIEQRDNTRIRLLCAQYIAALIEQAPAAGDPAAALDTLVLGCTHYPLVSDVLQEQLGTHVRLVESGPAVARRTRDVLPPGAPLHPPGSAPPLPPVQLLCTQDPAGLAAAAQHWLGLSAPARLLTLH